MFGFGRLRRLSARRKGYCTARRVRHPPRFLLPHFLPQKFFFGKTDDGDTRHRRRQRQPQRTTRRPPGQTDNARHQRRRPGHRPPEQTTDNQTRPPTTQRGANHQRREPTGTSDDGTDDTAPDRRRSRRRHQRKAARHRARNRAAEARDEHDQDRENTAPEDRGTRRTTANTANTPRQTEKTRQTATTATARGLTARVPQAQGPPSAREAVCKTILLNLLPSASGCGGEPLSLARSRRAPRDNGSPVASLLTRRPRPTPPVRDEANLLQLRSGGLRRRRGRSLGSD